MPLPSSTFSFYLGLGPCLYIKTQYLKWSILLSNSFPPH
eukprot:COSAG01_NODE_2241_length_8086_cov_25.173282_4_plen_39_part_00